MGISGLLLAIILSHFAALERLGDERVENSTAEPKYDSSAYFPISERT
jgi:hypothetical protein